VAALSETGELGFRVFLPAGEKLGEAGVPWADQGAIRTVRLEHGKPRYGEDIDERHIPQETQLMHAVSFSKGCYLGQEIVERVRSRGQVHRLLAPLRIESTEPPAVGTEVLSDGNKAGEITSAAFSTALGEVVALAYIRREAVEKPLSVAGSRSRTFPRRS
jgi:aminomethyltransferase